MHKLFNGRDVHVDFCKETSKKTTEVSNTVIMLVCPLRFPKKRVKNKKKEPFRFYRSPKNINGAVLQRLRWARWHFLNASALMTKIKQSDESRTQEMLDTGRKPPRILTTY